MVAGYKEKLLLLYFVMATQASYICFSFIRWDTAIEKKIGPTKFKKLVVCYLAIAA